MVPKRRNTRKRVQRRAPPSPEERRQAILKAWVAKTELGKEVQLGATKNINEILGNSDYARLRFGIGDEFRKGRQVDYVLDQWSDEETAALDARLEICAEAINSFTYVGLDKTMTTFNSK